MPVNPRRQTLAGAGSKAPPPLPPSNNSSSKPSSAASSSGGGGSSNGSVESDSRASAARKRVPMSRKSMIPRCATTTTTSDNNVNRENNNRAPSPLRPATASGDRTTGAQQTSSGIAVPSPRRSPRRHNSSRPPAMRKSMGGAILQHGANAGLTPHPNRAPSPARNRRVSLAPTMTSSSSSSSSGATNSGGGTVPGSSSNIDPRDIKDRSYLQSAIRKMVSYLTARGYADALSLNVKQLVNNGPSGRDFQNIMTFLFRRVDPTFHSTSAATSGTNNNNKRSDEIVIKFEDEVSMAFRCLGYPFPISKTGLVAVGSPHTWPALIAAIDWLVDLLTIRDEEEVHDWGPDDMTATADRGVLTLDASLELIDMQFHHFLRKSIGAFLKENDEECAELEGVLLDTFQNDCLRVEENLTAMDNECELMKEEIASLSAEVDGLSEAQQKQESHAADIEKFLSLIQTLQDHKAELKTKFETLTIEKSTSEQELKDCEKTIATLRDTINGQELSQEDVRRMTREKERIEEQTVKQTSILEGQVAALTEAKEKWVAIFMLLEQKVNEYNARARQLELIPETAKHAKGKKFEVVLDGNKAADGVVDMFSGVNIACVVEPHVTKLIKNYESETANEKKRMAVKNNLIKEIESEKKMLVKDVMAIKQQITSSEYECKSTKVKLEADIQDKHRQLEILNSRISSLNDPKGIESEIKKYDNEYEELKDRQREEGRENLAKMKAVLDEIRHAYTLAKDNDGMKKQLFNDMNDYISQNIMEEECESFKLLDSS